MLNGQRIYGTTDEGNRDGIRQLLIINLLSINHKYYQVAFRSFHILSRRVIQNQVPTNSVLHNIITMVTVTDSL